MLYMHSLILFLRREMFSNVDLQSMFIDLFKKILIYFCLKYN